MSESNDPLQSFMNRFFPEAAANSNPPAILPDAPANSNEPGDLQTTPAKSPPLGNLQIPPPTPTLEDRLDRANQTLRCMHVKPNGIRCGSPALRDEIYCYFHRIWRSQPDRQPFRPDPNGMVWNLPILEDADGIQMALQMVLDSVVASKMDLRRANTLLYGLQTAASNVRRTHFDPIGFRKDITTDLQ
jgi:hypothetical protein